MNGYAKPYPLYRVGELEEATTVYVVEGEKCVDAARKLGVAATTSILGADNPHLSDWSPLAGKHVILCPDKDAAGERYIAKIAQVVRDTAGRIEVCRLPGLRSGEDIADFIRQLRRSGLRRHQIRSRVRAANRPFEPAEELAEEGGFIGQRNSLLTVLAGKHRRAGKSPGEIRRFLIDANKEFVTPLPESEVESIARSIGAKPAGRRYTPVPDYRPFPLEALPEPAHSFAAEGAQILGCDPAFVAVPLLTVLAAGAGTSYKIRITPTWVEHATLWSLVVGRSGTMKSPAQRLAMNLVHEVAHELHEGYERERAEYDRQVEQYEKGKKRGSPGKPRPKPRMPRLRRIRCADTTFEAVAQLLTDNPHGLLLARDEGAAYFGGMDRYKRGSGDLGQYNELWDGKGFTVDRRTGEPPHLYASEASLGLLLGCQPGAFRKACFGEAIDLGFLARFLITMPPESVVRLNSAAMSEQTVTDMMAIYRQLLKGPPLQSAVVTLGPLAAKRFREVHDELAFRAEAADGPVRSALVKHRAYLVRITLLLHLVSRFARGKRALGPVTCSTVDRAFALVEWFGHEAIRAYAMLDETEVDERDRRLREWISSRGGSVTANDVRMSLASYPTNLDAKTALESLVASGHGQWCERPTTARGGRPTREFVLTRELHAQGESLRG